MSIKYFLIGCLLVLGSPKVSYTPVSEISYEVKVNSLIRKQEKVVFWYNYAIYKLKEFEGFSGTTYIDMSGTKTIGYGHTSGKYKKKISKKNAAVLLQQEFNDEINFIERDVGLELDQSPQRVIALAMFVFNVGRGAWKRSELRVCVISGLPVEKEFLKWVYINKKKSLHLMKRRIFELNLYSKILQINKVTP